MSTTTSTTAHQSHHVRARSQPFRSRSTLAGTSTNAHQTPATTALKSITLTMQNRRWVN